FLLEEDVVAGAAVQEVLAVAAEEDVVAGAAEEGVGSGAADEHIVAVAAVLGEGDGGGVEAGGFDHVAAVLGLDDQAVVGQLRIDDVHLCRQSTHGYGSRGTGGGDHVVAGGAVDDDGVGRAVTAAAERTE